MSNNLLLVSYFLLIACLRTYCFLLLACLFVCVFAEVYPRKLMLHSFYHLISYANSYDYVAIKWLCVEIDRDKLKPNPIPISHRLPHLNSRYQNPPPPFQEANLVQDLKTLTKVMTCFEFYLQMVPTLCFL